MTLAIAVPVVSQVRRGADRPVLQCAPDCPVIRGNAGHVFKMTPEGEMMPTATWNGAVIAESDDTVVVEGNHYFPPDSLRADFFERSQQRTTCPWKGEASYYDVVVNGERNPGAAWYYPEPKPAAAEIKDRIAFWRGVRVS